MPDRDINEEAVRQVEEKKSVHEMLLQKFPEFDPGWPDEIKTKWFAGFEQLMKTADDKG